MNRRAFITLGTTTALGLAPSRTSRAAHAQGEFKYGESRLGVSDDERDGSMYVPKSYRHGTPMPGLMMLHGFMGSSEGARSLFPLAEEYGVVIIAPESRGLTWGRSVPGFENDVHYLGPAYRYVAGLLDLDTGHVALGGVSDGAGYALSMGLAYGNSFNHVMVFAGGRMTPFRKQGKPRLFFAHGVDDPQMPIDYTARKFVPQLKGEGYVVTYHEYHGGHRVPASEYRSAFKWFERNHAAPALRPTCPTCLPALKP
jgi:phospholipase/carboxylesterase